MQLIPALDLLDGKAVRLLNGKASHAFHYDIDPLAWAEAWSKLGATRLHLVNLSAAFRGSLSDEDLGWLKQLRKATTLTLEYGGGLRSEEAARRVLDLGYEVVLGSMLLSEPQTALRLRKDYGPRVIAGIDASDGLVATHGWTKQAALSPEALCSELLVMGFETFIFTDIARDGTLSAPNLEALNTLKRLGKLRLIASGGVGSLSDLEALKLANMDGAIVGKALLDGVIDPLAALEVCHA